MPENDEAMDTSPEYLLSFRQEPPPHLALPKDKNSRQQNSRKNKPSDKVDAWPLWNVLVENLDVWEKLCSERETDLLKEARLENSKAPQFEIRKCFPKSGFVDSAECLFWDISYFGALTDPANVDEDFVFMRKPGDLSITQEVCGWTRNLTRRMVDMDSTELDFENPETIIGKASRKKLEIAIEHPQLNELIAAKSWLEKMVVTILDLEEREEGRKAALEMQQSKQAKISKN
ncbi:unnamed protein product [Oikopleura dioica]|uniref:Uncharacterized protein n=1 Tax=Oikopleura dioica TaxID=34765 RepID=E4Y1U0_OIKDI|nr:unnamed protein product [Oikopleura dioica]